MSMLVDDEVPYEDCPSGACNDVVDCGTCDGSGDDGDSYGERDCHGCGGSGQVVPEHCCVCGGSPYCQCCRTCGASCVGDCRCPIVTERAGQQVTRMTAPNAVLAYQVLDHIDAHPQQWDQRHWLSRPAGADCRTAACFAGWACLLSGDQPHWAWNGAEVSDFVAVDGGKLAETRAAELLGLGSWDADQLFCSINTRKDLGRLVEDIFGPRPAGDA